MHSAIPGLSFVKQILGPSRPMTKKSRHVIANTAGGWSVRQTGASRATRTFEKQSDAVKYGRHMARQEGTDLYVHRRDGTIRHADSYGSDTRSSRGVR